MIPETTRVFLSADGDDDNDRRGEDQVTDTLVKFRILEKKKNQGTNHTLPSIPFYPPLSPRSTSIYLASPPPRAWRGFEIRVSAPEPWNGTCRDRPTNR